MFPVGAVALAASIIARNTESQRSGGAHPVIHRHQNTMPVLHCPHCHAEMKAYPICDSEGYTLQPTCVSSSRSMYDENSPRVGVRYQCSCGKGDFSTSISI